MELQQEVPLRWKKILSQLPEKTPPILIVKNMPIGFTYLLAKRLNKLYSFESQEVEEGGFIIDGMGKDGSSGMRRIKENGGRTIAQDKATCTVFGMPKTAIEEGNVDKILPLSKIPEQLIQWC